MDCLPAKLMKIRRWLGAALWSISVLAGLSLAAPNHEKKGEPTALEEQMDRMSSAFRKLRRQAGEAAKNESSLELVTAMRQAASNALELIPAKAAEVPAAERTKFTAGYREQMTKFIATLDALAKALKAGDNAAALKLVGELGGLQKAGHKEYKKPDRD